MATPLHDIDALVALAEGAYGPAQAWAAGRLAVIAPHRFARLPAGDIPYDEVLAVAPPRLVPLLIEALGAEGPVDFGLAVTVATLGDFGVLPEDPAPLAAALRCALRGEGDDADLWLAHALALFDQPDPAVLAIANKVRSPDRQWLLPAIVLRVADRLGALDQAAAEIAREINKVGDPGVLGAVLGALGVPIQAALGDAEDLDDAVRRGARLAGRDVLPPARQGSQKRRVQHAVLGLLDGVPGPGPALLRALYRHDAHPAWGLAPASIAAWLRAFVPADPLDDVLDRLGGTDPSRLSAARRAIGELHRARVRASLATHRDPSVAVLALPLLDGDPGLARDVVDLLHTVGAGDLRTDALARAAAWRCADQIPDLLADRATRDLGLLVAEWVPTEEVLVALLALPVPADRDARMQYAMCLAAMGDAAAVPVLEALCTADESGDLLGARALAESILHVRLG